MLLDTITWKDEELHICISEFNNSKHLDKDVLLNLANSNSKSVLSVQFFNGAMIVDEIHLLSAAQNAFNAWKGNYMKSRNLDVEMAIYASAQHQIGRALELMGVTDKTATVAVIVLGEDKQKVGDIMINFERTIGKEVISPFEMTPEKLETLMAIFSISDSELSLFLDQDDTKSRQRALSKCVVSRISQVATIS
jgi:tRNA threonylcarbamoyladenosine modification (KEOPS) complex Cgi121 subunit